AVYHIVERHIRVPSNHYPVKVLLFNPQTRRSQWRNNRSYAVHLGSQPEGFRNLDDGLAITKLRFPAKIRSNFIALEAEEIDFTPRVSRVRLDEGLGSIDIQVPRGLHVTIGMYGVAARGP